MISTQYFATKVENKFCQPFGFVLGCEVWEFLVFSSMGLFLACVINKIYFYATRSTFILKCPKLFANRFV